MESRIENSTATPPITGRIKSLVIVAGVLTALICSLVILKGANASISAQSTPFQLVESLDVQLPSVSFHSPVASFHLPVISIQ